MDAFREMIHRLVDLDRKIYHTDKEANPPWGRPVPDLRLAIIGAIAALVGWVLYMFIPWDLLFVLGGTVMIYGFLVLALGLQTWLLQKKDLNYRLGQAQRAKEFRKMRKKMLPQINAARDADPRLHRKFWWDSKLDPAVLEKKLPGVVSPYSSNAVMTPIRFQKVGSKLRLLDMLDIDKAEVIDAAAMQQRLQALNPQRDALVYQNRRVLGDPRQVYRVLTLYNFSYTPIPEYFEEDVQVRVDPDEIMSEYRDAIDRQERQFNALLGAGYATNDQRHTFGDMSTLSYLMASSDRQDAEESMQNYLERTPMYQNVTRYGMRFQGLSHLTAIPCATVYLSLDSSSPGWLAAVMVSRGKQIGELVTYRSNMEDLVAGFVTEFDHIQGRRSVDMGMVAIKNAVDFIYDKETMKDYSVRPVDVLGPRPFGLTDAEWAYVVLKGSPEPVHKI